MENTIGQRLELLMKSIPINQVALADKLGKKNGAAVSNWKRGVQDIPSEVIIAILKLFPNVNADWFINNRGTMFSDVINVTSEPTPPYHTKCTSGECIKEIERLRTQIDDLIDDKQRLKIQLDEMSRRGGCSPGELKGGVEAPGKTG